MIQPANQTDYDVIIIGGGPAGSTAAYVLAKHGRNVLVLEKDRFPRYHVGESLLPYCYFTLERLGVIDKLNASAFVKKYSVQFVGASGRQSQPFYFEDHMDGHPASQTWQVVRSDFDRMLLDNARDQGATVREGVAAKSLIHEGDRVVGVVAQDDQGKMHEFRAPMTIDASGRDMFALKQKDWRIRDPELSKISVWTYYKGAMRDEGKDEGATTVAYIPEKGWFWYIPLPDDMVSVGVVAERNYLYRDGLTDREPRAIFEREIGNNPWIESHLATGEPQGKYWVTGDYSYRAKYSAADGLVLAGDAFAFLDPVFSSGVFLALKSGELVGDAVHQALAEGDASAERFTDYAETFCSGVEAMRKLVYAFYDSTFNFGIMLKAYPDLRRDLTDCLIGNLYIDFDPLFKAVAEFARVPAPLPHGRPLVHAG